MRDQRIKDTEPSDPETDERLRGVSADEPLEDAEDIDEEDAEDDEEGGF
jgi:hypothetical protein